MSHEKATPNVGHEPEASAGRDAIHVAVVPMRHVGLTPLEPGRHLANGIVDPYRESPVLTGEGYWLFLYPGTITSLRHVWTHPSFPPETGS